MARRSQEEPLPLSRGGSEGGAPPWWEGAREPGSQEAGASYGGRQGQEAALWASADTCFLRGCREGYGVGWVGLDWGCRAVRGETGVPSEPEASCGHTEVGLQVRGRLREMRV